MRKKQINLVWLKRDLRTQDHAPLHAAHQDDLPFAIVYIIEPMAVESPDSDPRHWQFVLGSIEDMDKTLAPYNQESMAIAHPLVQEERLRIIARHTRQKAAK